jgi:nitroimidazol reductase NimA-like FMN-containing flavoprotein (pyridoxamine 5'-phosphate oxidase superfamily)
MEPRAELLEFPKDYGAATTTLPWEEIRERLGAAERYWLSTTRSDGRPHAIPIDGIWLDDVWYFGGSPKTVTSRNLKANPEIVMHLDDTMKVVIVEGRAEWVQPDEEMRQRLADLMNEKYDYGMGPEMYEPGTWMLRPRKVLAWNTFPTDATRFLFD